MILTAPLGDVLGMRWDAWLLRKDSNLEKQSQSLLCYRLHHGEMRRVAEQLCLRERKVRHCRRQSLRLIHSFQGDCSGTRLSHPTLSPVWLLRKDSNLERRNQNPPCYRLHHGEIQRSIAARRQAVNPMWAGAEALGFEPRWRLPTPNGFQDRRNRPLCQTSISTRTGAPSIWRAAISHHGAGGGIRTLTDDVQLILSQWRLPIPPRPHCVNHHTTLSRSNQQNHIGTDLRRTYAGRTMLRNAGAQSERTGATLALLRPVEAARGAHLRIDAATGFLPVAFTRLSESWSLDHTRFRFAVFGYSYLLLSLYPTFPPASPQPLLFDLPVRCESHQRIGGRVISSQRTCIAKGERAARFVIRLVSARHAI